VFGLDHVTGCALLKWWLVLLPWLPFQIFAAVARIAQKDYPIANADGSNAVSRCNGVPCLQKCHTSGPLQSSCTEMKILQPGCHIYKLLDTRNEVLQLMNQYAIRSQTSRKMLRHIVIPTETDKTQFFKSRIAAATISKIQNRLRYNVHANWFNCRKFFRPCLTTVSTQRLCQKRYMHS
jgi:hypothetical protein